MKPRTIIEQIAILIASLVWTGVVLVILVLFWVYQDVQDRWQFVLNAPPEALAQAAPSDTPIPTATPWPGPGPTLTPTSTQPPTPTATWVVAPPDILPETLNPTDPTPIPVDPGDQPAQVDPSPPQPAATATPAPPAPANQPPAAPAPAAGGAPTHVQIESVGIDADVIPVGWQVVEQGGQQYSIWEVADYAIGWHKTTAALGQPGNTVMAGHHNVQGEVFRDLVNVEVGDKVLVDSGGTTYKYVVELKTIVKEKGEPLDVRRRNAQWIAPTDDERVTFVTCWPYTNNTHRVIVVAKPE